MSGHTNRDFRVEPVIKINLFSAMMGTIILLQSVFARPDRSMVVLIGAILMIATGQVVQAWEALKARRRGGIRIENGVLLHDGASVPLADVTHVKQVRSGLFLRLSDGTSTGISKFVYARRDLVALEDKIKAWRQATGA